MNCKQGDLAIVKTTHSREDLRGMLVECLYWIGQDPVLPYADVWMIRFLGSGKRTDAGIDGVTEGCMRDAHLRPIRPGELESTDEREVAQVS